MGVELKTESFSARVGGSKAQEIKDYCEAVGLRPTEFVREAMDEFMRNHPIAGLSSE